MRRTTLALEDEVLRQLKATAAREEVSVAKLANRLLARALKDMGDHIHYTYEWDVHDGGKPLVEVADRDALFDAMEDR